MSSTTTVRRVGTRTTWESDLPDESARPAFDDDAPETNLADPARIASGVMLLRALEAASTCAEEAGSDGAVILVVLPDVAWATTVREEWNAWLRARDGWKDGGHGYRWHDHQWLAWCPTEQPSSTLMRDSSDMFQRAIGAARHCVGFAADPGWLPADLVHAADHRLELRPLSGADFARFAVDLFGVEFSECLSDEFAARLTPRLLRLARRRDQTPDAYVLKLRALLEHEDAVAREKVGGGVAPRDEPTLDRLHGVDAAVEWGRKVAADLDLYRRGEIAWADVDRGCLLSGPPGTGKTLFARALAATCGIPLICGSYGDWHGSGGAHQGDLLKAMKKTFTDARKQSPSILFIDEIDSFPNRATISHRYVEWETQVVNALLALIDGVEGREGVILLGACNHPFKLDPALVRSGRLDRHVTIGLPDTAALARILREHLGGDLAGTDLSGLALLAAGSTGADCERLVRGARRRARTAKRAMSFEDLAEEVGGAAPSERDLRVAAIHEAGHAVTILARRPGDLQAVALRSLGDGAAGVTVARSPEICASPEDLRADIACCLAGRAAEELVFDSPGTGAGDDETSDLANATRLATNAVAAQGLDEQFGLLWFGKARPTNLREMLSGDATLRARVRSILDEAYSEAMDVLRRHRPALEALAAALAAKRALTGPEAAAIVASHSMGVERAR